MKNMLPELLEANNAKSHYLKLLKQLLIFITDECSNDEALQQFGGAEELSALNVVEAAKAIIGRLQRKTHDGDKKIKEI